MVFWSQSAHTKAEHVAANKERDKRVRAHQLHMQSSEQQAEANSKSTGFAEQVNAEAGLDEDVRSQLGRQKQVAKQIISSKAGQLRGMRAGVRLSRKRARGRARSLGF